MNKLHEGGAAGHLRYISDNLALTFGEIKEVIQNSCEGKLERVSEKLDGINNCFTYDISTKQIKVARTGNDIKNGGMDAKALAKKFFGRGNVEEAFNKSFKVLEDSMNGLTLAQQRKIFGPRANKWYSMEIIYAASPNTVSYDSNNIVFHGWPIFEIKSNGSVEQIDDDSGVGILSKNINQMQKAVSMKDWQVRGPSLLSLKKISDGSLVSSLLSDLDQIMQEGNVTENDSMYEYLRNMLSESVANLGLPRKISNLVISRAIEEPGSPGLPEIKKIAPKEYHSTISQFIKDSEALKKQFMIPIEKLLNQLALEVLRGLHSTLIDDSDAEVRRIKSQLTKAISAINSSGNDVAMNILQTELQRLGNIENVVAAMEGIVFFFKGQAYKFTGNFAPAHQILSLFKYGRKGVPPMSMGEALLSRSIEQLLNEGGHAFSNVLPISLEDFRVTWPHILDDLRTLGCTKIEPIGSTGKKQIMGDIDIAAEFPGTTSELFELASDMFGINSVRKVGGNTVTISYPVYIAKGGQTGNHVQVDVMLGKVSYLSWSRFGTSPHEEHIDYSPLKGVARNILLGVVNRYLSKQQFDTDKLDRTRYNIDFDNGLYKVVQTRRNKMSTKPPTKDWRILSRELLSDDPDLISQAIFGQNFKANDLRKFEDVVRVIKTSPKTKTLATEILNSFNDEIKDIVLKMPHVLGDNPERSLSYIETVINNN